MTKNEALKHFKKRDPRFHTATKAHHASLPPTLSSKRTNTALFESLVSIVVSQQLGTAAANSIFKRVKKKCGGRVTPDSLLELDGEDLRATGLSGAKIKTIKALAESVRSGSLNLLSLNKISEEEAAAKLMSVWGLGPWSVEMFMMFSLGRSDVFSVGDLGLARSIESIYGLKKGAPREKLKAISESWAPYRTYACLLLWRLRDGTKNVTH